MKAKSENERASYLYVRLDPALHATVKAAAATRGVSMQALVEGILDKTFREAEPGGIRARLREIDEAAAHGLRRSRQKGGSRAAR
jgi:HicB-like protein involved in pilus formation